MAIRNTLEEIEKKRNLLKDVLSKNNMNLRSSEVLKISRELDELIAQYIEEVYSNTLTSKIKKRE